MEALLLKVLSMILSVLMFFNNAFSLILPDEPVENVTGIYGAELFETDGEASVISDYISWYTTVDKNSVLHGKYDWKFFFNRNIALVTVELPNQGYTVRVDSVSENGETLELEYTLIEGNGEHGASVGYEVILIETSKNIKSVSASGEIINKTPEVIPSDNYYFVADKEDSGLNISVPVVLCSFNSLSAYVFPVPDELAKYDTEFFKNENLAVVPVILPGSSYGITVNSVTENDDTVEIDYTVSSNGEVGTDEEIPMFVFVETNKTVVFVSANETLVKPEKVYEMKEFEGYSYFICESDNFSYPAPYNEVIHDAESFRAELSESASGFSKYDEEYFEEKSLAFVRIYFMDDGMNFRPSDIEQKEIKKYSNGELVDTVQRLEVTAWTEQGNSSYKSGSYLVVMECNKDIDEIKLTELGFSKGYGVYDYEMFSGLKLLDGESLFVYDYETWNSLTDTPWFYSVSGINEKYFEEKSLVLTAVLVPHEYYTVKVNSVSFKNALVEIDCALIEGDDYERTLVNCEIIAVEAPKNAGVVNLTVNSDKIVFDRYSLGRFNMTTDDAPMLVSDYETWSSLLKKSTTSLDKYNEEYFENKSLVVVPETFVNGAIEPELLEFRKNGDTLNIVYGLNRFHDSGFASITDEAIIFEADGDIKNISVERKDLKCRWRTYGNYNLMMDEPTVISDYSEWASMVDVTNENYSMYDEEYFKKNSVVIFTAMLPDSGSEPFVKYAYEDGNTLEVAYTTYSTGGLTMIYYKAVLVEVSKNITEVNMKELR